MNYYNEFDPKAAEWLRQLIIEGLIPEGEVDERDIRNVRATDLAGFRQCHFFAGIGGWSEALRIARWPRDREVWTGSCPCQPFSVAGKGKGEKDERHLWPEFHRLVNECRPSTVFGEQVASKAGRSWCDGVQDDMEALGYGFWPVDLCSASVGSPNIRQRLWWVANATSPRTGIDERGLREGASSNGPNGGMAHTSDHGRAKHGNGSRRREAKGPANSSECEGIINGLADANQAECRRELGRQESESRARPSDGSGMGDPDGKRFERGQERDLQAIESEQQASRGADFGRSEFWSDFELIECSDGKQRRIAPGIAPLAYGLPSGLAKSGARIKGLAELANLDGKSLARAKSYRITQIKGYGNAINPWVAAAFIETFKETIDA